MRGRPRVGAGADVVARACAGPVTCVCTYIVYYIYILYYIYIHFILRWSCYLCVHISYIIYTFHIPHIYIFGITYVYMLKKTSIYTKKKADVVARASTGPVTCVYINIIHYMSTNLMSIS